MQSKTVRPAWPCCSALAHTAPPPSPLPTIAGTLPPRPATLARMVPLRRSNGASPTPSAGQHIHAAGRSHTAHVPQPNPAAPTQFCCSTSSPAVVSLPSCSHTRPALTQPSCTHLPPAPPRCRVSAHVHQPAHARTQSAVRSCVRPNAAASLRSVRLHTVARSHCCNAHPALPHPQPAAASRERLLPSNAASRCVGPPPSSNARAGVSADRPGRWSHPLDHPTHAVNFSRSLRQF